MKSFIWTGQEIFTYLHKGKRAHIVPAKMYFPLATGETLFVKEKHWVEETGEITYEIAIEPPYPRRAFWIPADRMLEKEARIKVTVDSVRMIPVHALSDKEIRAIGIPKIYRDDDHRTPEEVEYWATSTQGLRMEEYWQGQYGGVYPWNENPLALLIYFEEK